MNFDLTGIASDDEPGVERNRPLRGYRKRWRPSPSAAAESQEEILHSEPGGDLEEAGPYGPAEVFGFGEDTFCIDDWIHVTEGLATGAAEQYEPSSPADELEPPVGTVALAGPQASEPAWQQCAASAAIKRQRMEMPKLPWERPPFDFVFRTGDKWDGTILAGYNDLFAHTTVGCADVLNSQLAPEPDTAVGGRVEQPPVVRLNFKKVRTELPDEDIRRVALSKLRDILLQDPLATQIGTGINNILNGGGAYHLVEQSIGDCFRSKASSTLQKRAGSLWRLCKLLRLGGTTNPLRLTEESLYGALCTMRESVAGATSAQHALEALAFLDSTAKLLLVDLRQVVSGRCRGVARDMYLTKNPLEQKHPLKLAHVRHLELLFHDLPTTMQCILGQILFCIHACCRWKDSQRIKNLSIEVGHGEALIHAEAIASKTAVSAEARTRFLPYVALGTGVMGTNWGSPWLSARLADGLDLSDHALPSFSERTLAWTSNPMSASEATYWLREFLEGALEPGLALRFGSHSCKTTLLTWAGRSTKISFSPTERRLLGHHLEQNMKSILTYSREAFTSLYSKVLSMFKCMRDGSFDPDLAAIDRVVQLSDGAPTDQPVDPPSNLAEVAVPSDSESSVASECGEVEQDPPCQGQFEGPERISLFPDFPGVAEDALLVHRVSGLVHVLNEDNVLLCGRMPSLNFKEYACSISDRGVYEGCAQCKKAFGGRNQA